MIQTKMDNAAVAFVDVAAVAMMSLLSGRHGRSKSVWMFANYDCDQS
jgi:hypothetical protein